MSDITRALALFIKKSDEDSRLVAYELGRSALATGAGLLEWIGSVYGAIAEATRNAPPKERERVAMASEAFLLECTSAYEMAFQGAREANNALRRQTEILENETRRIAGEIHDVAGQLLIAVYMELHLAASASPESAPHIAKVTALLDQVQTHLRRFAHELRPAVLDDLGLMPALRALGESVSSRGQIAVSIEGDTNGRLAPPVEVALYRTVQEALSNATKHSGAARAEILVERSDQEVRCTVTDDGKGFTDAGENGNSGLGLIGLRERVEPLGGSIRWGSIPGASGAVVVARIPLEVPHAPDPDQ